MFRLAEADRKNLLPLNAWIEPSGGLDAELVAELLARADEKSDLGVARLSGVNALLELLLEDQLRFGRALQGQLALAVVDAAAGGLGRDRNRCRCCRRRRRGGGLGRTGRWASPLAPERCVWVRGAMR